MRTTHPSIKEKKYTRDLGGGGHCVKNRTEPCHVAQVAEVIAGVRGIDVEEVVRVCGRNVHDLFGSMERRRRREGTTQRTAVLLGFRTHLFERCARYRILPPNTSFPSHIRFADERVANFVSCGGKVMPIVGTDSTRESQCSS